MSQDEYMSALDPEIISRFKAALEIGKWPDGNVLTDEQKQVCMQAIIVFEHNNVPENERTGYVPPKPTACGTEEIVETPIKWDQ